MILLKRICLLLVGAIVLYTASASASLPEKKVACERVEMTLNCAQGKLLHIIQANYGRTTSNLCGFDSSNTQCESNLSNKIVKDQCHGRVQCSIRADSAIFQDPCPGTNKYLEVLYRCDPEPTCNDRHYKCNFGRCIDKSKMCDGRRDCTNGEDEIGCDYKTSYVCENNLLTISCNEREIMKIVRGNYGRSQSNICPDNNYNNNLHCYSPIANDIVKQRCAGKNTCSISASDDTFTNPCKFTYKYLEVHYFCLKDPRPTVTPRTTTSTTSTTTATTSTTTSTTSPTTSTTSTTTATTTSSDDDDDDDDDNNNRSQERPNFSNRTSEKPPIRSSLLG